MTRYSPNYQGQFHKRPTMDLDQICCQAPVPALKNGVTLVTRLLQKNLVGKIPWRQLHIHS